MADRYGYGGFSGVSYPFWLSPPSQQPPASAPVDPYDPTQVGFDPMIPHPSYHQSPVDWSNNPSYRENPRSQTPSSFYPDNTRPPLAGNYGPRGEEVLPPGGFYLSRESSSDFVNDNFSERQRLSAAPPSSLAEMLIRTSHEPFFKPLAPSGVCGSSDAFVTDNSSIPPLPMSRLRTQALFDGSQTAIRLGDGGLFPSNSGVGCNFIGDQSNLRGSSVEPVNFDVLLGYGEATGHIKPLSENPDFYYPMVGSPGLASPRSSHPLELNINSSGPGFKDKVEGSGVSSLYQRPNTLVAESSLKNAVENSSYGEPRYWTDLVVSSEGPSAPTMFPMGNESYGETKADNGNAQYANQPSEDVQSNQQPCELQEQIFDIMNRDKKTSLLTDHCIKGSSRSNADDVSTDRSPEKNLCDQGSFPSPTSSPRRVSSVVNAMHNLSEVLVYECFNNGRSLKLEQLENLDKVVDNLTKCLKKITDNKTIAGESSPPTQAMHISCPNMVNLSEAPEIVAKDSQELNAKPIDSFGFKEPVDKNEMTKSIKNILASNFPDGEENHPQTLLYKNLWLETEAALCSTTCMARYHRIKNEIGNLKFQNGDISADASTFMQEPLLNSQKSIAIINNVEPETPESLVKNRSKCGNNVVTMSHDTPQSSGFNSEPVDAVLSLISRSFSDAATSGKLADAIHQESPASPTEDKHNGVIDRFQILKHQETKRKLKSQNCPGSEIDVIDRFQILKNQETNRKLKTQNCPERNMGDQENSAEASDMANTGTSSNVNDVMDRFQILKRREAEQVQKTHKSLDIDSDSDSDQPKAQMREPAASGKGYESPTSDWEHVRKDD